VGAREDRRAAGRALGGRSEADVRPAVLDVALRHHLVSRYTSLVAVDVTPARPAGAALQSHMLATNLPHGWDYDAVFGMGQGATDAPLHLWIGVLALLLAAAAGIARVRPAPALARRARRAR
jgi:Ca-activated chloride channel family protein